jgi:cell division protein FtsW (lipid II flippase)
MNWSCFLIGILWIGLAILSFFRKDLILSKGGEQRIKPEKHKVYIRAIRIIWAGLGVVTMALAFVPGEYVWWAGIPVYVLILAAAVAVRLYCGKKAEEYTFD